MKHPLSLILFLLISGQVMAQTIKGFVYEKETGEPALFANVVLDELGIGTATDVNGYFSFNKIEEGNYTIKVSSIGFEEYSEKISLKKGKSLSLKIYLEDASESLDEIVLSSKSQDKKTEVNISKINITPKSIKRMPSIGGEADLAQYIQSLPGVVFTGDQGGQLYIRGGQPVQNKVLMDGMVIYNPFHSIGFNSVFDTEIIKTADIYTGGFGAEYGGRISSVIDIKTRDGNKKRIAGNVGMNTFGSKFSLEGPLSPKNEISNSTFILSAKTSYLDQTSKSLYSYANDDENGLPFSFNDLYGKVTLGSNTGSKISLFGFNFDDKVDYETQTNFDWNSNGFGGNAFLVLPNSLTILNLSFASSTFQMNQNNKRLDQDGNYVDSEPKTSEISDFGFNFNLKRKISQNSSFSGGLQFGGGKTSFNYTNINRQTFDISDNTTRLGLFAKYKFQNLRWVLEPSLRISSFSELGESTFEPRIAVKYNANENLRLKMSGGFYSQNLVAANNTNEVVNLFNGYLSSPNDLPDTFEGETISSGLQKARHIIGGVEIDVTEKLEFNIEAYLKDFYQLINLNLQKSTSGTNTAKDFLYEKGEAYGVDFVANYRIRKFVFSGTYSLGYVNLKNESSTYHPNYDRRHTINITGSYTFGEQNSWTVDARWNYGSGFPFAQIGGNYELTSVDGIGSDYTNSNGELTSYYKDLDSGRLPDYHRFDIALGKKYKLSKNQTLDFNLSVTNIYNRENIFYYDKTNRERIDQLPIIPSLGVNWGF